MADESAEILVEEQDLIIIHKKERKELQGIYNVASSLHITNSKY